MVWGSRLPLSGGLTASRGSGLASWGRWWQYWDGENSQIIALESMTKPSLELPLEEMLHSRSPGHSWPVLAVPVCWGAVRTPAPWLAQVSHFPQHWEGMGGREANFCVRGNGLFWWLLWWCNWTGAGWCVFVAPAPPCGNEAGQRCLGLLAREKELNVGHFLRLSVAQCGGLGQEGLSGARCGGSEPLRSGA